MNSELPIINFNYVGFNCSLAKRKIKVNEKEWFHYIKAKLLDRDVSDYQRLATIKSWIECYKYNKIGGLKRQKGVGYIDVGKEFFAFSLKEFNKEKFLYIQLILKGEPAERVKSIFWSYQEAILVEMAVNKCLHHCDVQPHHFNRSELKELEND